MSAGALGAADAELERERVSCRSASARCCSDRAVPEIDSRCEWFAREDQMMGWMMRSRIVVDEDVVGERWLCSMLVEWIVWRKKGSKSCERTAAFLCTTLPPFLLSHAAIVENGGAGSTKHGLTGSI